MIEIAYTSRASHMFTKTELRALHQEAITFNQAHNITGLLVYNDGIFFQVLEGKQQVVKALYTSIKHDFRHYDVRTIYEAPLAKRHFNGWAMSFHNISKELRAPSHSQIGIENLNEMDRWIAPCTARMLVEAFKAL